MDDHRRRWGALAWLLTLQFFVAETIAELRFDAPYSRVDDLVSDLGASYSSAASLMNASFVLQAVLIAAGAVLLRPSLPRSGGRTVTVLLSIAAAGVLVVGVVPLDADGRVHAVGAVAYLLGSSTGLLALAHALRPRSELLGSVLAFLGIVGAAATVFFFAGITRYLGEGGTERAAAYVLPIGLAVAAVGILRTGPGPRADDGPRRPGRRELRARERAEAAQRAAERDAALERYAGDRPDEDHWAPSPRRGD
jgi:hypothetical membrane protein